jgi:hypothetical protein
MKLDCQITDSLQRDFSALWKCQQRGNSLEITTPYLLPDSTLLSLFLTERENRFIVSDGGGVFEVIEDYCPYPAGKALSELEGYARKFGLKRGQSEGKPLFFKESDDIRLISSLAFDVASFATMATSALVAGSEEIETEDRFKVKADAFLKEIKPAELTVQTRQRIPEVSGFTFSAVITAPARVWLVSYVTGSNITYFRRSLVDTMVSFQHAWQSPIGNNIGNTIPLLNDEAPGYRPSELGWQLNGLAEASRHAVVRWTEHEQIRELLG